MSEIFKPLTDLRPSQLIAVADRRFDDAVALSETGDNARANGVQYLAGLVIEISLKAELVRQHPSWHSGVDRRCKRMTRTSGI